MDIAFTLPYWSIPAVLSMVAIAFAIFIPVKSDKGSLGAVDPFLLVNYLVRFLALVFALTVIWCIHYIAQLTLLTAN
jgi:hypothetical protein